MSRFLSTTAQSILNTSSKMLGVKINMIAKNATIATASYGISILRGIVTGYLVARLFPRALYGEYQFIVTIFGAMTFMALPGINSALQRAVARGDKGVIPRVFRLHTLLCLGGSVLILCTIPFLAQYHKLDLWPSVVLAAILFPLSQAASSLFGALVIGEKKFALSFKANLTSSIAVFIATLLIIFLKPSSLLLFAVNTIFPACSYLFFSRAIFPAEDKKLSPKPVLRYAFSLTLASLSTYFTTYIDKLLISAFLGINQLAVFSVSILLPEQIKAWSKELLPVVFAIQASGEDTMKRRLQLIRTVLRLTVLLTALAIVYALAVPVLFHLLFPNYIDAIAIAQVTALLLVFLPNSIFIQYLEAQALVRALQWTQWISMIVYCVLLLILLPRMGLIGAVLARTALRFMLFACSLFFLLFTQPRKS